MKKWLTTALVLALIALMLAACAQAEETAEPRMLVPKGGYGKLEVEYDRKVLGASPRLLWESSNPAVATVNGGHVRGVRPGRAVITCTALLPGGQEEKTTCLVEVYQPVTALNWQRKNLTLITGQTSAPVSVSVSPADAAFPRLTWSSTDERVATVDARGRITGVSRGRATIYGTLNEPGVKNQRKMWVSVLVNQGVTDIGLSSSSLTLARGKSERLTALVFPENAVSKWLNWSSSDEQVATVSKGRVTGVGIGHCTVTARAADGSGVSAVCEVEVIQPMTGLALSPNPLVVMMGDAGRITAQISPADTTHTLLYWYCDRGDVARVDSTGLVTGRSPGKCRVYADASDVSGLSQSAWVFVEPASPLVPGAAAETSWLTLSVANRCAALTVMGFEYEAAVESAAGEVLRRETGLLAENVTLWPGAEKTVPCPVPGAEEAERVAITVTAVQLSDGRRWEIPDDQRSVWDLSRENTNDNGDTE